MPEAFRLVAPRTLAYRPYQDPPLGPRDVRLESILSGISHGTELNLYRGTAPFAEKHFDREHRLFLPNEELGFRPTGLGYELVSRVVEVGADVHELPVGSMVHTATNHQPTTLVNLDENARREIPMQVLPPQVTPEQGVFAALVGVALAAVHDAAIKVGDHVAVFGLGTIGLIAIQLARLNGALRISVVDPVARRREMAAQLGADTVIDPNQEDPGVRLKVEGADAGPDVVIEASGSYHALQGAIRSARMAGRVVTLGYYQGGGAPLYLGEEWHHNRVELISSMAVWGCPSRYAPLWDRPRISRTVIDLLARGLVRVDDLITQRFPYAEAARAYAFVDEHPEDTIKVVLSYT